MRRALLCCLGLAWLTGCGQSDDPVPAPEASNIDAENGAETPLARLEAADRMFRSRKYADSRPLYEAALASAVAAKDKRIEAEALAQIARTFSAAGALDMCAQWLARAKAVASKTEPWGWTRYLGVRGILERERGARDVSLATFTEMFTYASGQDLPRRALDAVHHAAIVAPPKDQEAWAKRGIAAAEKLGDDGWLAVLWNNLGVTYEDLKDYEAAVDAYLKARTYHHKGKREVPKMIADWAVGHAHRLAGHSGEAKQWLTKTLAKAERLRAKDPVEGATWVGYCLEDLGHLAWQASDPVAAANAWRRAAKSFVVGGMDQHWPEHLKELDALIAKAEAKAAAK